MSRPLLFYIGVLLLGFVTATRADEAVTIVNAGFEEPALADSKLYFGDIDGWSLESGDAGLINPVWTDITEEAPEGQNVLWVDYGSVRQELSATIEEGVIYRLEVKVTGNSGHRPNYVVSLDGPFTSIATISGQVTKSGYYDSIVLDYHPPERGPTIGMDLSISLADVDQRHDVWAYFDDVRLTILTDCNGNGVADIDEGGDTDGDGIPDVCDKPALNVTRNIWYDTIQLAIDDAANGEEIEVAEGVYSEAIDCLGKTIYLHSAGSDPNNTYLNGTGHQHTIQCISGESSDTIIEGFTVMEGGTAASGNSNGGGFYIKDSSPTVKRCIILTNMGALGGGMYCENSNAAISECRFESDYAESLGGGLYVKDADVTVTGCTFAGCQANAGGAICQSNGHVTVEDCLFATNNAQTRGGAIISGGDYENAPSIAVTRCVFENNRISNSTYGSGGAIRIASWVSGTMTDCVFKKNNATSGGAVSIYSDPDRPATSSRLSNCTFDRNRAKTGGGLFNGGDLILHVDGCDFTGNSAESYGGAVARSPDDIGQMHLTSCLFAGNWAGKGGAVCHFSENRTDTVTNCTFTENLALENGGAIYTYHHFAATNSIFWNNTPFDVDVAPQGPNDLDISYCVIGGAWYGEHNTYTDPLFVQHGHWEIPKPPAGMQEAHWYPGDFRLTADSPCIDAGNTIAIWGYETDTDGQVRVINDPLTPDTGVGVWNMVVDQGAYEYRPDIPCRPTIEGDINCDGIVDFRDLALVGDNWLESAYVE